MTELGESAAVIAEQQLQEDHWVKVEYTYSNGLPVEGYFYATDGDGIDWAGKLNDKGQVCLSGLPPGNVSVELIPGDEENELKELRKAIKQALDGIVEAEKQEAATVAAGYQKYGPAGYHVAVAKGLWDGAVGLVSFAWDTVKTAAEIAQYLSPAEKLGNFLNATYKSYQSGSLSEADWRESLIKNYQEEEFKDLAELLGFDVRALNKEKLEEIQQLIIEAYEITAFIIDDPQSNDLFEQFAKDYAKAQSSYEYAELAGGGIFEIVVFALLLAFTAGLGNAAQAASKVRHVSKLKNLGTLFRKLGKILKRKKLNRKLKVDVDSKKKVEAKLPDGTKLKKKGEKTQNKKNVSEVEVQESAQAQKRASNASNDLPPKKTVSSNGDKTISGWSDKPKGYAKASPEEVADYSKTIGHELKPAGAQDQIQKGGFPGKYNASHAEKQMAVHSPNEPLGVSKPMCKDCQDFFTKHAKYQGQDQVITDPNMTRIFHPDGRITEIPLKK